MKIYRIFIMLFLALAINACQDKDTMSITPATGEDVQFGLALRRSVLGRTVYGTETDTSFPIYWVDKDQVVVSAPDCMEGRNKATYQVSVANATQNYADELNKVGETGVQWGTKEKSKFYSVYPASNVVSVTGSKFTLRMPDIQELTLTKKANSEEYNDILVPNMDGCILTAATDDVVNGEAVQLYYSPFATAIRFRISGYNSSSQTGAGSVEIRRVRLVAPQGTYISGNFNVDLSTGDITIDTSNARNYVRLSASPAGSNGNIKIAQDTSVEYNAFIIPQANLTLDGWYVEVETDQKTQKLSLKDSKVLMPGQVHRISKAFPNLVKPATEKVWDPATWMVNIPRNVYLSEVSIPGSWNSLNKDFQGASPSLATQYSKGVRAFHLDARWKGKWTKSAWYDSSCDESEMSEFDLSVADGNDTYEVGGGFLGLGQGTRVMKEGNTTFADYLSQITGNVKSDEYMVVFCSFAQGSYNNVEKIGKTWMQAISDACAANASVYDASKITPNTTIGEVLGSVIVIVNSETPIASTALPANSKCFFSCIPNNLSADYFPESGFKSDALYASSSSSSSSSISLALSQAQITSSTGDSIPNGTRGYYPSLKERSFIVNNILDWSKDNYEKTDYAHDKWIYLGLGGNMASRNSSTGDDNTTDKIATEYSTLINNRIAVMNAGTIHYYPLGIVYLNTTTTEPSVTTVKNILELNSKYRMQYDDTKPAFPNVSTQAAAFKSAAPGYSSGMVDNNTNAIGWE